jgi:mono/diheme cytochrome c family protein
MRAQDHASTRDGVYTERQAARGESSYKMACASCHGPALQGKGAQMPQLAGPDFVMNWNGQTVGELFERIQSSMPADRPGTLARSENADIVAFLLKSNNLPAGKDDLPSDADALKRIQFDAPKE